MKYYLLIYQTIHKYIIEYVISIAKKLFNYQIVIIPNEEIPEIKPENTYIFMGLHYVNYPLIDLPNVYYMNLEQLTINGTNSPQNLLTNVIKFNKSANHLKLLDYSEANVSILKEYNIPSVYIPYQVNYDEIFNYKKELDFVLCCTINDRKLNVFNRLNSIYPKSQFIGNPQIWGKERDNVLFKSKILINIHHVEQNYEILEEIRLTRCILNKIIIISEPSKNSELYPLNSYIVYVNYDEIVSKTQEILNNYEEHYNKIYKDLNTEKTNELLSFYLCKLPNFLNLNSLNGLSDVYNNRILNFNNCVKNNKFSKILSNFTNHPEIFGIKETNNIDDMPTNINYALFEQYLSNNKLNLTIINSLDVENILMSIILVTSIPNIFYNTILEIGAGCGNMLRLNHNVINFKTWILVDYIHMNLLQEYYLSENKVPRNKYILSPNYKLDNIYNNYYDLIISVHSLNEYSLDDFIKYYEKIICNCKYFYYVFNKEYPSFQVADSKIKIINENFNLIKNINSKNNMVMHCIFINKLHES